MTSAATYLERLARETNKPETEVLALALQVGLKQLWRERLLGQYLRGEMTREEAIDTDIRALYPLDAGAGSRPVISRGITAACALSRR